MKPKVALVKDGFLPPGSENTRGRMSKDAIARCEALAAKGWSIDGFSAIKTADTSKPVTVERVKTDPNRLVDVPDMRKDERDWEARINVDGKSINPGFRITCNGCQNSLGWCYCATARVNWLNAEHVVTFKPTGKKGDT